MILFFYNLALLAALVIGLPWWLWKMATTHKYRSGISERLGNISRVRNHIANSPDRQLLWLHAVSVGEVLAVSRLVTEVDRAFPEFRLLISTTTRTGQDLAIQRFGADRVFYCPLDLPWAVRAYLAALKPRMLVLAETEFWPNILAGCFRRNIPVVVVNARISDRSWPRYRRLRALWRPMLGRLSRGLAQSDADAKRLLAIGCRPDLVTVAGNLKFDVRAAAEAVAARLLRSSVNGCRFIVAGSTINGEEATLLQAWPRLLAADPNLVLVLAPRHPERFSSVENLLTRSGLSWARRSDWNAHIPAPMQPGQVVMLDSIGELTSVYSLASVAFVGGTIAPAGGHNPLEPAQFGIPIAMGPNYANFRDIVENLLDHQALRITQAEDLAATLIELLSDGSGAPAMGERARQVFEQQAGATSRCVEAIRELLVTPREREP